MNLCPKSCPEYAKSESCSCGQPGDERCCAKLESQERRILDELETTDGIDADLAKKLMAAGWTPPR